MNPNTNRILWLLVALTAFGVWWDHRRSDPQSAGSPLQTDLIPGFHPESAMVVEIRNGSEILRAERRGEEWRLTVPVDYQANPVAVNNFLQDLTKLKKRTAIDNEELASNPNQLESFGLQPSLGSLIIQRGNLRDEIHIGKETVIGDQVYIKMRDESRVMVTSIDLLKRFPTSSADWRTRQLVDPDKFEFNRISIRRPGRVLKPLEFTRESSSEPWKITKPLEARANSPLIESLIQKVLDTQIQAYVADYAGAQLEAYGLNQPQAELAFGMGEVDQMTLRFGPVTQENPDLCLVYRLPQENVVLVDRQLVDDLQAPFVAFRDVRVMDLNPSRIGSVDIKSEASYSIVQSTEDETWRIIKGEENFRGDNALVRHFLTSLVSLEIVEFHSDVVTDYSLYGLDPARERIVLNPKPDASTEGVEPLMELAFGTNLLDRVLFRRMDEKSVYAIGIGDYQRIAIEPFKLRDRKIFNFEEEEVTKVVIRNKGREHVLERSGAGGWKLGTASQGIVEIEALKETLRRLGQLVAESWVEKGRDRLNLFGIGPESHTVTLSLLKNGETTEKTLVFGNLSPLKRPYTATEIEGETYLFEFPSSLHYYVESHLAVPEPGNIAPQ